LSVVVDSSVLVAALVDTGPHGTWAEEILAAESIVPWNAHMTELEYGEHVRSVLAQLKTAAEERLNQLAQPALSPP